MTLDQSKILFIRKEVARSCRGVNLVTDKAIRRVMNFSLDRRVTLRNMEDINRGLIIPLRFSQARSILSAARKFERPRIRRVVVTVTI